MDYIRQNNVYIEVIHFSWAAIFTAKKTPNFLKWHVTRNALHQHLVKKSDARKQTCILCVLCVRCEVMHAMSIGNETSGPFQSRPT